MPFSFSLYDQTYNGVNVNSNGRLDFVCINEPVGYLSACLPAPDNQCSYAYTIFGLWSDYRTDVVGEGCSTFASGCGIFTSVSGTAPNRIFNIEWRAVYFADHTQTANFEIRLYENSPNKQFDFIFGTVQPGSDQLYVSVCREQTTPLLRTSAMLARQRQACAPTPARVAEHRHLQLQLQPQLQPRLQLQLQLRLPLQQRLRLRHTATATATATVALQADAYGEASWDSATAAIVGSGTICREADSFPYRWFLTWRRTVRRSPTDSHEQKPFHATPRP